MTRSLLLSLLVLLVASCGGPSTDDFDGDGSVDSVDCAPEDPSIHLGAPEICSDGIDNDCDSWVDCEDNDCLVLPECESGDDDDTAGDDDDTAGDDDDDSAGGDDDDSAGGDDDDSAGGDDDDSAGGDDDDSAGDDDDSASSALTDIAPQGITMIALSGGTFDMGCTAAQQADNNCETDESPVHSVTLTKDFWMGETEVTQGQWQALMGTSPSYFFLCGGDCPVEAVNWFEAVEFANALSAAEGLAECYQPTGCTGTLGAGCGSSMFCLGYSCASVSVNSPTGSPYDCEGYRLPTEAEWEYAARAGTDLLYSGSNTISDVAWHSGNSANTTRAVATMQPNAWGLYDMTGNLWEWTWDWYGSGYYSSSPSAEPEGPSSGSYRVVRGGGWQYDATGARVAGRYGGDQPGNKASHIGFRLARTIPVDADGDGAFMHTDCDDSDPQAWERTSSLSFDGVDDYLELASTENAFSITDEFTLSAWIRRAGTGSGRSTVLDIERFGSNSTLSDNVGIELLVDDNGYLAMGFGDGASWHTGAQDYYVSTAALVPDQVWTHIAVTRSGMQIGFYLDGSLADMVPCHWGTVDFSAGSSREDDLTRVGMSYQLTFSGTENNVRFFDGDISQVGIWNRELTEQEVSTLLGPLPAAGNTLTNLQGYWSLEATSFVDATGYHGTASINGPELSASCFP